MAVSGGPPVVAVLAGGRAERLGGRKPSVQLAGRPLVDYPLRAAHEAGLEAVVVAKPDSMLPALEERIIYDEAQIHHPLAGVLAALREFDSVIAVACDMPFITSSMLRWMGEQHATALVTRPGAFIQPFPALYGARNVRSLQASMNRELSLQASIERLRPQIADERDLRAFGPQVRLFFSVNTPADVVIAESLLRAADHAGAR